MKEATRMCPECLTTDASFPNIIDCASCKEMLEQDEYAFWNTPLYWENEDSEGMTPRQFMGRVVQPWRALFSILTMT